MNEIKLSITPEEFVASFDSPTLNEAIQTLISQGYTFYSFIIGTKPDGNILAKLNTDLVSSSSNEMVKELDNTISTDEIVYCAYSSQNNALYVLNDRGEQLVREWSSDILQPPVETLDDYITEFMREKNLTYPFFVVKSTEDMLPNQNKVWIAYKRLGYSNYNLYYYMFGQKSAIWTITENSEVDTAWASMTADLKTNVEPLM